MSDKLWRCPICLKQRTASITPVCVNGHPEYMMMRPAKALKKHRELIAKYEHITGMKVPKGV